jgi:hypothetical protein
LLPFRRRIDFSFHSRKTNGAFAGFFLLGFGIDNAVGVRRSRAAALPFIEDLRAVKGQREILNVFD